MFFNLTWRNAKRSRSENLIYFLTMITAVAMFYIVLSLGQQDVIRFLSEIESDAVERLLTNLLPTVYLCALLFVFFLVVVVEDDVYMREELLNLLEKSGYDTIGLSDFENAVSEIAAYFPDLILLDINLPFRSGFEICKELKAKQIGTVLVLTARDKLQDELHALDLGADDYLTKPCNMSRLLARIKNLLRRKEEQVQQGLLDGGGFLLDPNTFTIYVGNSSYLMPPNEGKILLALLKNSPKIVSKKELCIRLWGTEEFIDENALQVNFTRLRKTLREFGLEERIETVRGQGYRLKEQVRL